MGSCRRHSSGWKQRLDITQTCYRVLALYSLLMLPGLPTTHQNLLWGVDAEDLLCCWWWSGVDKTEYLLAQRSRCSLTPARCTAQSASRLSAGALGINTITARRQGELGGLKYEGDSNTQCSVLSEVSSQEYEIMNNVMVSIKPLWVSTPAVHCWSTQSNKTFYLLASADWGWAAEQRAAVAAECNCNIAVLAHHQPTQ